jgi:hypothetical protein
VDDILTTLFFTGDVRIICHRGKDKGDRGRSVWGTWEEWEFEDAFK